MHRQNLLTHLLKVFSTSRSRRTVQLLESPLAGCQHHRAAGVWPFLRQGEALRLVREPNNPHDPNAIAVYFRNDRLGYVPRRENRALAAMLDRGETMEARITRLQQADNPWQRLRFSIALQVEPIAERGLRPARCACTHQPRKTLNRRGAEVR